MDRTDALRFAQTSLAANADRLAALVRGLQDPAAPLGGGSRWSLRDVPVHLTTGIHQYSEYVTGTPSPYTSLAVEACAAQTAALMADIAETDPERLAGLMLDAGSAFLRITEGREGADPAPWHCGLTVDIATLASLIVAEQILHGYDLAKAVGSPWPIDPAQALLALGACAPLLGQILNPATAGGHTAAYRIELRGGPSLTVRFTRGSFDLAPPEGPADVAISADPVAFLLIFTGRMSRWDAIACNLLAVSGTRTDLGLAFADLFAFP
jgi:hypothetical protein